MNNEDHIWQHFEDLLDGEAIAPSEELEQLLAEDEGARRAAVRLMLTEALLVQEVSHSHAGNLFSSIRPANLAKRSWQSWAVAAASVALVTSLAFVWLRIMQRPAAVGPAGLESVLPTALALDAYPQDECAILTNALDVTWGSVIRPQPGDTLGQCRLKLTQGVIQLEFCSGATVVLEAPADFEIQSSERAVCKQGKVHVHAPTQAAGFVVSVPGMDVVDLGTEFALRVTDSGKSEVHVLEGEVSLESDEQAISQRLNEGQSAAFDQRSGFRALERDGENPQDRGAHFIDGEQLSRLASESSEARHENWKRSEIRWADDPDTICYFDFSASSPWSRTLTNLARGAAEEHDGAVIGCDWRDGRWPGENSIEFKGVSDRVRLMIPGEYDSVSYMAWVSIDGFNRQRNALVLTDGWEIGEPHWQIGEQGELVLGVSHQFNEARGVYEGADYKSPPVLDRSDLGRWILLATVYDRARGEVVHYADGVKLATLPLEQSPPVRFGTVELGNWRPETQKVF